MGKANQGRFTKNEGVLNQDQTLREPDEGLVEKEKRDLALGKHGDPLAGAPGHRHEAENSTNKRGVVPPEEEKKHGR